MLLNPDLDLLTSDGVQVKQYLGYDNSSINKDEYTQSDLKWITVKELDSLLTTSAIIVMINTLLLITNNKIYF
jgi:hypothetical protein